MTAHDQRKIRSRHGNVELQGQRLSAYASTNISTLTKPDKKINSLSSGSSVVDKTDFSKKNYKLDNPKCSCDIGHSSTASSLSSNLTKQTSKQSSSTLNRTAPTPIPISKDQSTATTTTTHVLSNHRHNVPLQAKSSDQILKCSCNISADTTAPTPTSTTAIETTKVESALERKQNILLMEEKKKKNLRQTARKEKRDAATSPQLPVARNNSVIAIENVCEFFDKLSATSAKCEQQHQQQQQSPKVIVRPSPRREIPTRNAATSPQHINNNNQRDESQVKIGKKNANTKTAAITTTMASKLVLEKSKSLNETRPQRQLRTTRSLSPRPPVRHQQAIIISDENDIVLEVTRSEDFNTTTQSAATAADSCDRLNVRKASPLSSSKIIHKAQSENTSPNLHDGDAFFAGDQYAMNMSTGCLVYVPSDPWMKMTGKNESLEYTPKKLPKDSPLRRISKIKNQSNTNNSNDPWVYRNSDIKPLIKSSPKPSLGRQSKSLGASIQTDNNNKSNNRPKLQRCKSPTISDDAFMQQSISLSIATTIVRNSLSPQKLSTTTITTTISSHQAGKRTQSPNCLLNVSAATNSLLQPRHSFSSLTQKDDELQLNIRRLSEQIKPSGMVNSTTNIASADFSTYLKHCSSVAKSSSALLTTAAKCDLAITASTTNISPPTTATKIDADIVLETTC